MLPRVICCVWFASTLIAGSLLTACATPQSTRTVDLANVRQDSLRSGVCTLHNVALQRTTVYEWTDFTGGVPHATEAASEVLGQFPNATYDPLLARERSWDYKQPKVVRFCPACDRLFEDGVKRWSPPGGPYPKLPNIAR